VPPAKMDFYDYLKQNLRCDSGEQSLWRLFFSSVEVTIYYPAYHPYAEADDAE